MSVRVCEQCGKSFDAPGHVARFCSSSCRARRSEGKPPRPAARRDSSAEPPAHVPGTVVAATREALMAAGREGSPMGQAALRLAERLDDGESESGSALAALSRSLREALDVALANAAAEGDTVDEVSARREAKIAAARRA